MNVLLWVSVTTHPLITLMNNFQVGDLVAHKHYPENAIGKISKFYASGRVGVDDGCRPRSFLPSSLILCGEKITPGEPEKLDDAIAHSEVMEHPPTEPFSLFQKFDLAASLSEVMELRLKPENLPEPYESCPQCGSKDLEHFTYHNPDEYYFYCRDCGREGWSVPTTSPTPPAQVEEDFDIDNLPTHSAETEDFDDGCPECGCHDLEATPLGLRKKPDYYLLLCPNCTERWWFVDKLPASLMPNKSDIANSEVINLQPVPRDFSNLKEWPEWWERPALPDMGNPDSDCVIGDEEDDWQYVLEFEFSFRTQYRNWLIEINDEKIYATEPSRKKCWWCECERDIDGPDGQIAIAQEFIDSWYFAQPSPGQPSLLTKTVAA